MEKQQVNIESKACGPLVKDCPCCGKEVKGTMIKVTKSDGSPGFREITYRCKRCGFGSFGRIERWNDLANIILYMEDQVVAADFFGIEVPE